LPGERAKKAIVLFPLVAWNRTTLVFGVLGSLALSVGLTLLGWLVFDTAFFALFLFLPFLPILFRRRQDAEPAKRCPKCGWSTTAADLDYCPRDGERLGS
jgi:hypothetical protein